MALRARSLSSLRRIQSDPQMIAKATAHGEDQENRRGLGNLHDAGGADEAPIKVEAPSDRVATCSRCTEEALWVWCEACAAPYCQKCDTSWHGASASRRAHLRNSLCRQDDTDSDGDGEGDAAALRANRPVISTMDLGTDLQGLDLSACFGQHMLRPVLSNVKLALGTREMSEAERATAAASERLTQEDLQHVSGEKEQIDYSTKSAQGQGFLAMLSHFSSLEKQQEESPPSDVLTSDNFADQFA